MTSASGPAHRLALVAAGALLQRRKRREDDSDERGTEDPIEDPVLESPTVHAVRPAAHGGAFGDSFPMLHGSAADGEGHPAEGAVITITGTRGRQLLRTRTDALGRYAVAGLPEDVVTVVLSAPPRTPAVTQVLPATGLELRRDSSLRPGLTHGTSPWAAAPRLAAVPGTPPGTPCTFR
ncbi:carboxypeptidase-like regulatory domain-containing protein, partial [Streptomyces sp. MCAF7]